MNGHPSKLSYALSPSSRLLLISLRRVTDIAQMNASRLSHIKLSETGTLFMAELKSLE